MTSAVVSQVASEALRTNLSVGVRVEQLVIEVLRPSTLESYVTTSSDMTGDLSVTGNAGATTQRQPVRVIRKPQIPAIPQADPQVASVLRAIKENIEIISGVRGSRVQGLPTDSNIDDVIAKINEIIAKLSA